MAVAVVERARYQRSPVDALRLVVAVVGFVVCLALAVGADNTMVGIEADLLRLVVLLVAVPGVAAALAIMLASRLGRLRPPLLERPWARSPGWPGPPSPARRGSEPFHQTHCTARHRWYTEGGRTAPMTEVRVRDHAEGRGRSLSGVRPGPPAAGAWPGRA